MIAAADSHDTGVTLYLKLQLVLCHRHTTSFAVHSLYTDVHEVGTVSPPRGVLRCGDEAHGLTCGLDFVAGYDFPIRIGDSLKVAVGVCNVVPLWTVTLLGVADGILFPTKTLSVKYQFHLFGIGISIEGELCSRLATPVVAHSVVGSVDAVPHDGFSFIVDDGDVYQQFFWFQERLHEKSFGLRFEGDIEHALRPTLCGPSLTLAEVVDGSPVGQAYHLVKIHLKEVRTHVGHVGLALVERHPGEPPSVAGEVHIAVVVRLYVGDHRQVVGQGIGIPVTVAWVHGHGHKSGGVVALQ